MPAYIVHAGDTNTYFGFPSNDAFRIVTSGSERLRVEPGVDVGIGTNNPAYKLEVNGTAKVSGDLTVGNILGDTSSAGLRFTYLPVGSAKLPIVFPQVAGVGLSNNVFFGFSNWYFAVGYFNTLYRNAENTFSDDRLKTDESLITNATETLLKLKPQTYTKHMFKMDELTDEEYSNVTTDGLIYVKSTETWVDRSEYKRNTTETRETHPWIRRTLSKETHKEAGLVAQDIWYDTPELKYIVRLSSDASPAEEKPISETDDIQQDPDYDAAGWGTTAASVNYTNLIPYLIKSIQELHERIKVLENPTN
jgi:hypothetical protein